MKERDYDVIVYGAGPEGVAAALEVAERSGSVLLVCDGADVGGSAACGLMDWWRGESETPLAAYLRKLTRRAWGRLIFEPEELAHAFRKLLRDAGVHLLLGARLAKAKAKRGCILSVTLAGHAGRKKLSAWCYVDASQDFALARTAGAGTAESAEIPRLALLARVGGIDTRVPGVFDQDMQTLFAGQFKDELATEELPDGLPFPMLVPCPRGGTAVLNASGTGVPLQEGNLGRTEAESLCREQVMAALGFLQRNVPGYENCHLIHYAGQALVIQPAQPVRRRSETAGEDYPMSAEDIAAMRYADPDRLPSPVTVPLGNLMCAGLENLLLARAEGLASDQVPLLLECGAVAGRVAAEAVLYDGDILKLDEERLLKAVRG